MTGRRKAQHLNRVLAALLFAVGVALILMPGSDAQADTVVINEMMIENLNSIVDGDGDHTDWIELHNTTGAPIDISGWQIRDTTMSWPFPAGTSIGANGYLLVWASDKGDPTDVDYPGPLDELHTNFKLSSTLGESVTLSDDTSALVDTVTFGPTNPDVSIGTDGYGGYATFPLPDVTPGGPNTFIPPTPTPTPPPQVGPPSLIFNEVMPSNTTTIADGDGEFEDWFELYNPTCTAIDLIDWKVADSLKGWVFPVNVVLAPGEVLLVWASDKGSTDDDKYPGPLGEFHTNFQLTSAGETVSLIDPDGFLIAQITPPGLATDQAWALGAGGSYSTVVGADITPNLLNPDQVAPDCTAAPTPTPTPGGPTPTPTPTPSPTPIPTPTPAPTATPTPIPCSANVVVNELMPRNDGTIADGDGDFSDWIELYNPSAAAIDLSSWTIGDSSNTWRFPDGASIESREFLVIWASDKGDPADPDFPGPDGEVHTGFRLSGSGEIVTLFDATNCEISRLSFPDLDANESYGLTAARTPHEFVAGYATPGGPNGPTGPLPPYSCWPALTPVRFNRIVAKNDGLLLDGDGDASDFIELRSWEFDPVDVSGWEISDENDTWIIPEGTVIGSYDTLIIWASGKGSSDDDKYPGPLGELHTDFKLASEGELVTLAYPASCISDQVIYPELDSNEAYGFDIQGQPKILVPGSNERPCATPGSVLIVGVQAKNEGTIADEDGEFGDWIELRNATASTVDLGGWVISDDGATWVVPDGVSVQADAGFRVWADGKNRGGPDSPLHTNFKLASEGETVSLGSSSECAVHAVTYPELQTDQVWAVGADGLFSTSGGAPADADEEPEDPATGDVTITGSCVAINEIMAKNDSTIEDDEGEFGDWIELVNIGEEPIDLSGWELSDEKDSWVIPDGVEIGAGQFLLIWADENDSGGPGEPLHANFKLGSSGEPIKLVTAEGEVAAELSTYPELDDDEAFGVNDDGDYVLIGAGDATPGEGPTITDGCDFNLSAAAGAASADTNGSAVEGGDSTAENIDEGDDAAADQDLARTGTDPVGQTLPAQLLLLAGVVLVVMARISERRAIQARTQAGSKTD